ncbi:radical SAM family heme chaperone HemW [Jannaschia sp. LMIT008]|uniref:radical SAM family heme chaperone HemW n=1 Tax=Jannaschia maritima TaxID=3032585 RepID=UPI002812314B|nr:radical SAM family heme chaperone HemW [Jannaschia sp. LMIT008]
MTENWQEAGFGLYVHWPFCEAKCPYCDFNSHVTGYVDETRWRDALLSDLRHQAACLPDRRLGSIFFGGGTPSRMPPDIAAAIIAEARRLWTPANDLEITLEANPTSVETGRFHAFRDAGVNRVSLGVQSLRNRDLRALGRTHDVAQALRALQLARDVFDRTSFDLIYARQGQTLDDWRSELGDAVALQPDHLSVYQLTIEPGTVFARRHDAGRLPGLPDDDVQADLYLATDQILERCGMPSYEVSNHAVPGRECRHNLTYWRAGDWVGVGPGAHGRLTWGTERRATRAVSMPEAWLGAVDANGHGLIEQSTLPSDAHADEYLIGALRLRKGLDLARLNRLGSIVRLDALDTLMEEGLASCHGTVLRPTARGRALCDSIIAYLAARSEPTCDRASHKLSS